MSRNINEKFLSVLPQYDGTVDDRRKKYLQDTYGFSDNSALPSMEYQVLGDLGYTGTIDDRWSKYLKALGGTGLSSRAQLLSSTFYGFYSANSLSPEFVLDFERETYLADRSSTTFDDALTFARSGSATYVDSTGTIQTAADGEHRIGHHVWNGSEWVNEGLLLESESRTNLLTHSEDFTNVVWTKVRLSVNASGGADPAGGTDAFKLVPSAVNSTHLIDTNITPAAQNHTLSIFAKKDGYSGLRLRWTDDVNGVPSDNDADFDLDAGEITNTSGSESIKATIENIDNGWYRLSFTVLPSNLFGEFKVSVGSDGNTFVFSGDETSGVLIYGAQFEEGSTPSSYIPTNGSTVTRAGETLIAPEANLPWSTNANTVAIEGTETYADLDTAGQVTLYDRRVDANNRITLTLDTDGAKTGTFTLTLVNGGSTETISTTGEITPDVNEPFNVVFVATSNELGIALNGMAETRVSHSLGLPDLSSADATHEGMGTREQIREWDEDLGDEGLAEASS